MLTHASGARADEKKENVAKAVESSLVKNMEKYGCEPVQQSASYSLSRLRNSSLG